MVMRRQKAFSLIELMITVTVVLVLFCLTMPKLGFFDQYFLYREQDLLCATIAYTQHKAIATNKQQTLTFDLDKNSYSYSYPSNNIKTYAFQRSASFGFLPGAKGPPSKPDALITQAITFDSLKITCLPNGAMTPGTIYLLNKKKTVMVAVTVGITEVSCVRKYSYQQDRWVMTS